MTLSGARIRTVLLTGLFLMFNVGLPIVLNTCPMPRKTGSMACPLCRDGGWDGHGTAVNGKPCCDPRIAAERNLNEFIGASNPVPAFVVHTIMLVPTARTLSPLPVAEFSLDASPPHQLFSDIPVALSTLLI